MTDVQGQTVTVGARAMIVGEHPAATGKVGTIIRVSAAGKEDVALVEGEGRSWWATVGPRDIKITR